MREIKVDKNTIRAYIFKIENERKENVHTFIVGKLKFHVQIYTKSIQT